MNLYRDFHSSQFTSLTSFSMIPIWSVSLLLFLALQQNNWRHTRRPNNNPNPTRSMVKRCWSCQPPSSAKPNEVVLKTTDDDIEEVTYNEDDIDWFCFITDYFFLLKKIYIRLHYKKNNNDAQCECHNADNKMKKHAKSFTTMLNHSFSSPYTNLTQIWYCQLMSKNSSTPPKPLLAYNRHHGGA